ncbi:alpha/beta fold hydrolase [Paracoccus thiocyanatus]|uniref:alpha/beta fold hydrolase n=1 Tax=Paracoccus thiocyanatus TaxID=34006 RepID=UPI0021619F93|nr:alpha/beta fold hydrolase [Paracoccus thiocyanatus]
MSALHLRRWPGNEDRPALALHCMMGNAVYWGPIAQALRDRVRVSAPDLPGHGQSPDWAGGPPDYHTAVTRAAAALIDRPLDLIGHSMGATVALRIAVAAPQAVRSLTLIEPVLFAAAPEAQTTRCWRMSQPGSPPERTPRRRAPFWTSGAGLTGKRRPRRPKPGWRGRSVWSRPATKRCATMPRISCAPAGWNPSTRR